MKFREEIKFFLFFVLCLGVSSDTSGQLCSGSLGDPVVNITLGSGSNPGQALGSSSTNYNYVANSCPTDGSYTIINSTTPCFNNTWHVLAEDHTSNDVNGYMMLVNASYNSGDFYVQTVNGLCGGTTYEFAAWILNIEKPTACNGNPIKPNVTFNIETTGGTVLLTTKTGDIPSTNSAEWKQYGAFFTTPAGISTVVIRMTNNAPGGCGNDLALDDITFRPCGPKVTASISGSNDLKDVCAGDTTRSVLVSNVNNSYSNQFYQWQLSIDSGRIWNDIAGATGTTYTRPGGITSGSYLYRLAVAQGTNITTSSCRVASNVITININALPVPSASNNGPVCEGDMIKLNAINGSVFSWSGPDNFTSNIQSPGINNASSVNGGKYYVTVVSDKGCNNIDSTTVIINKSPLANAGSDVVICEGTSTTLQGRGINAISYSWSPSAGLSAATITRPVASPVDTTIYILTVTNGVCKNSDTVVVNVLKKPTANAGNDVRIMQGDSVALNGSASSNISSFYWSPAYNITGSATLHPVVSPSADTTYTLHVTTANGCGTATDAVFVRVYKKIVIPNAFSPNNDGINDYWNIEALQTYANAEVSIFNRYGQPVFHNKGLYKSWNGLYNGRPLPVGTYYYIIDVKEGLPLHSGSITLLR